LGREFDRVQPRYAAAVEQLKAVYKQFEAALIPVLKEAQIVDRIVRELSNRKPTHLWLANNDGRTLPTVELAGRSFAGVAQGCTILTDLKMPAYDQNSTLAWPLPEPAWAIEVKAEVDKWLPPAIDPAQLDKEIARIKKINQKYAREQAAKVETEAAQRQQAQQAAAQAAVAQALQNERDEAARNAQRWGKYPWMS
jgi:hypothetical protein